MARVLVTGGAGFIGSHLCDRLVARGDEVVVLDDLSLGREDNLASAKGVRLIKDSVLNVGRYAEQLAGVKTVFHLAALISGYDSLQSPDAYLETNVTGLLRVLELCRGLDAPRVVFASSSTVYGNRAEATCRESDLPAPVTLYALTKLAGEHLLSMYSGLYGYQYCALRLFNVYGPRQNPRHPYANVTCKFSHAAAGDGRIKLYGDGAQSRDFVHVDDVVDAMLRAAEPTPSRIYNVGTGRDVPIRSLIGLVEQASGRTLEVEACPPWSNDIRAIRADAGLLARELGLTAQVSLADGLRSTVEFFRAVAR